MPGGGSKPGERRGGRAKGTPNKVTPPIRAIAQEYGADAIKTLASIMKSTEHAPAARVAAAGMLLDRGYGKSAQPIDGDGEGGPIKLDSVVEVRLVRPER